MEASPQNHFTFNYTLLALNCQSPHSPPPYRKWNWHVFYLITYNCFSNFINYGEYVTEYFNGYFIQIYFK